MKFTGGMVAEPTQATRGIVAGSAFAVYELMAYMHEEASLLASRLGKHGQLTIHVDDIAVTVEGDTPTEAVQRLHEAGQALVQGFEVELELPFDKEKAFLVANSKATLAKAAKRLGAYAGQQAE